ncbi:hypothetical protein HZH66_012610 [Vespula vulgaris]|uniref:Uncharacterized protein n=1 Tax=Vespula vulgaris TaxID=7454 RepID=A0A834MT81_VESVU|nr:hypothetical protein HZH66_012610 [Vespula vulgaris]
MKTAADSAALTATATATATAADSADSTVAAGFNRGKGKKLLIRNSGEEGGRSIYVILGEDREKEKKRDSARDR